MPWPRDVLQQWTSPTTAPSITTLPLARNVSFILVNFPILLFQNISGDPFYGVVRFDTTTTTTVTVEAINCNGQRATKVVKLSVYRQFVSILFHLFHRFFKLMIDTSSSGQCYIHSCLK